MHYRRNRDPARGQNGRYGSALFLPGLGGRRYIGASISRDAGRSAATQGAGIMRWAGAMFVAAAMLWLALPAQAEVRASDIRIGRHPDKTRIVIELSEPVEAKVFALQDPYRLVIDLPEIVWTVPKGKTGNGAGLIERFRFGLFQTGTSRVVLDLTGPAEVRSQFILRPDGGKPWRLVLDLAPTSREQFAAVPPPVEMPRPEPRQPPTLPQPRSPDAKSVVVIDPGHGGVDPGATGLSGAHEKTIVLDYARALRKLLLASNRYEVVLTRDRDVFMRLRGRTQVAQEAHASLFISLHVNTDASPSTAGFSAYTLSAKASDEEVAALAAKENKSDVIAGIDLEQYSDEVANILIDFAQSRTIELSVQIARDMIIKEVSHEAEMLSRPWRSADFAVLKAVNVPSVLIELGYVSNRDEEGRLLSASYRTQLCEAMVRAINRYFTTVEEARRP